MSLGYKQIEEINEANLQALVDDQVHEDKTIEYKEALPGNLDSDKIKFLASVSSFANTVGGDLIFGIKEDAGTPIELLGLQNVNIDETKQRLENLIRNCVQPRISGIDIHPVPLKSKPGVAIVIRIPRSWALPHMITLGENFKFYARNSAGRYAMDVSELRVAFTLSTTTADRIRAFRGERLGMIAAGEAPVLLDKGAKVILHIVPFNAFDPASRLDLTSPANWRGNLPPIAGGGWNDRFNFDGYLTYSGGFDRSNPPYSYVQLFRNGSMEAVSTGLLGSTISKERLTIPSDSLEQELLRALPQYLSAQKQLGVEPPLSVMLSLLGVSGYSLAVASHQRGFNAQAIDRADLLVPEVMVEDFITNADTIMRPLFDTIWNACGYPKSLNFNDTGKRIR